MKYLKHEAKVNNNDKYYKEVFEQLKRLPVNDPILIKLLQVSIA